MHDGLCGSQTLREEHLLLEAPDREYPWEQLKVATVSSRYPPDFDFLSQVITPFGRFKTGHKTTTTIKVNQINYDYCMS